MPTPTHHLAQINVARMRAPLTDELMAGFVAELAPVNALADHSPGFVWRLQSENSDATSIRVFPDEMILVNMSLWESLDALKAFVYRSHHTDVLRQREQWFERMQGFYTALWWLPAGEIPSALDGKARLDYLEAHGESPFAFTFKKVPSSSQHQSVPARAVPWDRSSFRPVFHSVPACPAAAPVIPPPEWPSVLRAVQRPLCRRGA